MRLCYGKSDLTLSVVCRESSEAPVLGRGSGPSSGGVVVTARVAPGWLDRKVSLTLSGLHQGTKGDGSKNKPTAHYILY